MKQLQFYKYATWTLLLLNLSMIAFFFLTIPPRPRNATERKKAFEVLKLDEQQKESLKLLVQEHMQQMDDFSDQQRNLLKPYFHSLIDQNKPLTSDTLLNQIQHLERKKVETTYQHFQGVKSILRTEQYADFEKFVEYATGRILLDDKKKRPPSRKN